MAVADPSGCRHMSPASLKFAALTQQFIRATSKLPAWDKRKASGREAGETWAGTAGALWRARGR